MQVREPQAALNAVIGRSCGRSAYIQRALSVRQSRVLRLRSIAEQCLYVNDWRPIDGLNRPNPQPSPRAFPHRHAMQSKRVRSILRARREYSGERVPGVVTRADLEHVALRAVEPGNNDELVA